MTAWQKETIAVENGEMVSAQMPVIVSASRSTDIPAFYSDWFVERFNGGNGYVKWFNPFNNVPLYVGFNRTRLIEFWSKNPRPMLEILPNRKESPLDVIDVSGRNYYFQFTLNDYGAEKIEPSVPPLAERIETFKRLAKRIGRDRVVWRFDPLILSDSLTVAKLLEKVEWLGDRIAESTSRLVFSFIDIAAYKKVAANLERGRIKAREFQPGEMDEIAGRIGELAKGWGIKAATCGEVKDLDRFGIEHSRCIDDRLIVKCFSHDTELMKFVGGRFVPGDPLFGVPDRWEPGDYRKDKGQRAACGCIMSKDIGEYNTCPHLCHYCYANANNAVALVNRKQHVACPYAETIMGKMKECARRTPVLKTTRHETDLFCYNVSNERVFIMKKFVCVILMMLAVSCFAEVVKFDGLFGFKFGMQTPRWDPTGMVDVPLKKPVMRFEKASLIFNVRTKEVCLITATGGYPRGTSAEMIVAEAERLMSAFKKRYGIDFVRYREKENDVVRFVHLAQLPNEVFVVVDIIKFDEVYMLEVIARDQKLQDEANKSRPPALGEAFDVNDPIVRRALKVSNIKRDSSLPEAVSFEYVNPYPKEEKGNEIEGCSIVLSATVTNGVVAAIQTSNRFTYGGFNGKLEDALKKACSVWGSEPWLRKRLSMCGEVWTEIAKSVPLSYVEAKGMKFDSEQERALAAFSAAKEVGLIPEIWVRGMYIPLEGVKLRTEASG